MRVVLGLFLLTCLASLAASNVSADLHFGYGKAQEGRVLIPRGGTFEVTLDSNPTTGYSWAYSSISSNNLTLISNEFIRPQNSRLIGSGGKQVFVFKADGPTTLHLRYARAWENNVEPASSVSVKVEVSN
jgi:predicted secreted protein